MVKTIELRKQYAANELLELPCNLRHWVSQNVRIHGVQSFVVTHPASPTGVAHQTNVVLRLLKDLRWAIAGGHAHFDFKMRTRKERVSLTSFRYEFLQLPMEAPERVG